MKPYPIALAISLFATILLSSCQSLDDKIADSVESGHKVDDTECSEIQKFVRENAEELQKEDRTAKLFDETGQLNVAELGNYIRRNRAYRKLAKNGNPPSIACGDGVTSANPLQLKFFLEASASMFPYDAPGTNGQFKSAINQLLNEFNTSGMGQTQLYVVNTEVNPLGLSRSEFIKERDIFAVAKTKGRTTSTDFEQIFQNMLAETKSGDVSVLTSDLIYSDPQLAGMSVQKTLNAAQNLLANVFNRYARTHAMLVLKLAADYKGKFYSWDNKTHQYTGQRPYYICLIADNATMNRLLTDPAYSSIRAFDKLPNFSDYWYFGPQNTDQNLYFSILTKDPAKVGSFSRNADEMTSGEKAVHALESVQPDTRNKKLTIPVSVNLQHLHLPPSVLTDASQYVAKGKDNFRVVSVSPYTGAGGATHKLLVETTTPARGKRNVTIRLRRQFPPRWVAQTTTTNDNPPDEFHTFGLQNLLQGIEQAYNPSGQTEYFTITLLLDSNR